LPASVQDDAGELFTAVTIQPLAAAVSLQQLQPACSPTSVQDDVGNLYTSKQAACSNAASAQHGAINKKIAYMYMILNIRNVYYCILQHEKQHDSMKKYAIDKM
jgi:hypothetical protein